MYAGENVGAAPCGRPFIASKYGAGTAPDTGQNRADTQVCPYRISLSEKKDQQNNERQNNISDIELDIAVLNPAQFMHQDE
jgi:hypothetical protein